MKPWHIIVGLAITSMLAYRILGPEAQVIDRNARIEEGVLEKLEGWMDRRNKSCRTQAMKVALKRADSLILEYAREQKLMLDRPSRPLRPEEPELRRPSDTLALEPFLGDTLAL